MAPIRRYLQITKHSAIELRIHVEEPSLAQTWLLHPTPYAGRRFAEEEPLGPVLPRVIAAIRPAVERQLRDEQLRIRGRGTGSSTARRRKGVKDVASGEDFEVSVFLTEPSVRHSLLLKQKGLAGASGVTKGVKRREGDGLRSWLEGTGGKDAPLDLDEYDSVTRKRRHNTGNSDDTPDDSVFLREESMSEDEGFQDLEEESPNVGRAPKRRRVGAMGPDHGDADADAEDDKKSLNINTTYEGFSIYGRVLSLVVKPKGIALGKGKARPSSPLARPATGGANADGQARGEQQGSVTTTMPMRMMESWVSTQAAQEAALSDDGG